MCSCCASVRRAEFAAEICIHVSGLKNLNKSGVLVFANLLVCTDCGFSWFTTPKIKLASLTSGTPISEASTWERKGYEILCNDNAD